MANEIAVKLKPDDAVLLRRAVDSLNETLGQHWQKAKTSAARERLLGESQRLFEIGRYITSSLNGTGA